MLLDEMDVVLEPRPGAFEAFNQEEVCVEFCRRAEGAAGTLTFFCFLNQTPPKKVVVECCGRSSRLFSVFFCLLFFFFLGGGVRE